MTITPFELLRNNTGATMTYLQKEKLSICDPSRRNRAQVSGYELWVLVDGAWNNLPNAFTE